MINQNYWNQAIERVKAKRQTENYPNIYVQYLNVTRDRHLSPTITKRLKSLFCKDDNVYLCDQVYSSDDLETELSLINTYIDKLKVIFTETDYCNSDRRKSIIMGIQEAMVKASEDDCITQQYLKKQYVFIEERTSESDVFVDERNNIVWKIKDIYAHDPTKPHNPWDSFYEFIATNILFPNVPISMQGFGIRNGNPAIVFTQKYIRDMRCAKESEVDSYLLKIGLHKVNKYNYSNDIFTITDVMGKNVLADDNGNLFFIDPNIYFLRPWPEIKKYLIQNFM